MTGYQAAKQWRTFDAFGVQMILTVLLCRAETAFHELLGKPMRHEPHATRVGEQQILKPSSMKCMECFGSARHSDTYCTSNAYSPSLAEGDSIKHISKQQAETSIGLNTASQYLNPCTQTALTALRMSSVFRAMCCTPGPSL